MINTARIGNLRGQVPVEYKNNERYHHQNDILQGRHRKVNTCTMHNGTKLLSVGNSLAAATPACIWKSTHTLTGIQRYTAVSLALYKTFECG